MTMTLEISSVPRTRFVRRKAMGATAAALDASRSMASSSALPTGFRFRVRHQSSPDAMNGHFET